MGLGHANSFRDLMVHQKARETAKTVFQLSKLFPKEEMFSLTDQIRRSSRSICDQIAEAGENDNMSAILQASSQMPTRNNWNASTGQTLHWTACIGIKNNTGWLLEPCRRLAKCCTP